MGEAPDERRHPVTDWHALRVGEVLDRLSVEAKGGLDVSEAGQRRRKYGYNRLPTAPRRSAIARFFSQFNNLLIRVLLAAATVTALLAHWIDTGVILAVVLVNAVIGFLQEGKAEKALEAIRDMLSPNAAVLRGGSRQTIPAAELVPGDIVLLEAGDRVPADLRLIRVKNLRTQEAMLTGESVPVEKSIEPVASDTPLADRNSMAWSGTLVTAGQATGVVVETGASTEIGRISGLLAEVQEMTTPLLRAMDTFARWLTVAIIVLAAGVFAFGVLIRDLDAVTMFMSAVALAVAAIPEGLPTILTVTLAIGVQRMASRNTIIRRLPAVETLGSVSIICSDKTGTLTRNEMTVRAVVTGEGVYEVSGVGYDPHGGFMLDGEDIAPEEHPLLVDSARAMILCNDAALREQADGWVIEGDPMEGALLTVGRKAGLDIRFEHESNPRTDVIPFESEHRFMATLHHDHEGNGFIFVKGAPERLLSMCSRERTADSHRPIDRTAWLSRMEELAARGMRVLAVACRPAEGDHRELRFSDVEDGLTICALFGLIDPPREEAIEAVRDCHTAGIRVKMITGDHPGTALAIAASLGLANTDEALTGADVDTLDDAGLSEAVERVDVFARTTPEHKLRIVKALHAKGYVVAMTGDGVNDAPALKQADVGVAMGMKGTETAKEAAEMVLADDNFASIARAVREGRTVYDNLKKAIVFLLPINGGESGSIIAAILLGHTLPITPLQVLWVNMVSSVGLAMALAFEPAERNVMRRPPRAPGEPIISPFLIWRVFLVSVIFLAGIFGVFFWADHAGYDVETSRTFAVNTLVAMEVFYLLSVRTLQADRLSLSAFFATRAVVVAVCVVVGLQMVFTYLPFMQGFFASRALGAGELAVVVGIGFAVYVVLEIEKWAMARLR